MQWEQRAQQTITQMQGNSLVALAIELPEPTVTSLDN
jgi:hypothetical protein